MSSLDLLLRNSEKSYETPRSLTKLREVLRNSEKSYETPRNATKLREMLRNSEKCYETPRNATKLREMLRNSESEGFIEFVEPSRLRATLSRLENHASKLEDSQVYSA